MSVALKGAHSCLIVGCGPAGLFAADRLSRSGIAVSLFDRNPGPGRKFLIAGRGGLNLTHSEPLERFASRYSGGRDAAWWRRTLRDFSPNHLREWAGSLGSETFVGTSGRVFPKEMSSGKLLAAWRTVLRTAGARFFFRHRLVALRRDEHLWHAGFECPHGLRSFASRTILLATGGCSWPQTGSDGSWADLLQHLGISLAPFAPANCGWLANWPPILLEQAEGLPLKNISLSLPGTKGAVPGDLVITRSGLEGGPIYRLGPELRRMKNPFALIDLKPGWDFQKVRKSLAIQLSGDCSWPTITKTLRLGPGASALVKFGPGAKPVEDWDPERLARRIKAFEVHFSGPGPIGKAISTAGGVRFDGLDDFLMAEAHPGLFFAGEMLDWEAPTGGYLLQGCFSTAARAASGIEAFLKLGA